MVRAKFLIVYLVVLIVGFSVRASAAEKTDAEFQAEVLQIGGAGSTLIGDSVVWLTTEHAGFPPDDYIAIAFNTLKDLMWVFVKKPYKKLSCMSPTKNAVTHLNESACGIRLGNNQLQNRISILIGGVLPPIPTK